MKAPSVTGQLAAQNVTYNGTQWKSLQTGVAISPAHATLKNLRLGSATRGRVEGSADIELHDWKPTAQSSIQVELSASQLDLATIAALTGEQIPATGTLSVSAHLRGEATNPAGTAEVSLTKATVLDETVSQAKIELNGSGNQVKLSASVQLDAGTIQAHGTVDPRGKTFDAQLETSGIELAKLQAVKSRGIDAKGAVRLDAHGKGSFDSPDIQANLEMPTLIIGGQTISQTRLQVNTANRIANLDFASTVENASLRGKAQVHLEGDYQAEAQIDTQTFALQPFLAAYAPEEEPDLSGQAEIHATVRGPLKNLKLLEAHVKLPVLNVAYTNSIQLAATPIQADFQGGTVTLQPATIRGTDTDLSFKGDFPVSGQGPATLRAQGTVNFAILQIFDPDMRASGQLKLNIDSHGTLGSGLLAGEIDVAGLNLSTVTSPVGLQNANGVLKLSSDRLQIASLDGKIGGGDVSAQGAIIYRPEIQLDLGVAAKGVRMLYPQGVRETANANLRLTGSMQHAALNGSVTLTDLSFTPAFDLSAVIDQFSGGVSPPAGDGFAQNLDLNIALNSTNDTNLVSRSLSVAGAANLQIRGSAAEPVILGRVSLTGGDVILHGNRFVLTGGTIQFINPAMTQPVLNVGLTTTIEQYKINLTFQGTSDQLRTQYTSDPSLPPADIINLLAFGQTTEASAANPTPANQQAEGLVASQVSGQVTSRISKAAGISQLSISPVLAGGTASGPPGANMTIQQRVTGNLFVTFSTNVSTTQGQTIQGQYQVSPHVAVSATRDPNGGFAVDTLIKKSW
jgi:translocation and assembly module TamB